jgi:hypothetical protein
VSGAGKPDDGESRTLINLVAAIFLLLLAIAMVWVVKTMDDRRKLQRCLDSGRRDCVATLAAGGVQYVAQGGWRRSA